MRNESRSILSAVLFSRVRLKRDGTRAETRFRLSPKWTSPFKSAGASVQSTAGSRGVRISVSNAGYATFRASVRVLATRSIRQFPLHLSPRASPCAVRCQTHYTTDYVILPGARYGILKLYGWYYGQTSAAVDNSLMT